ncbi:MAG: ATP-binding cassette domain-containing protein [Acidimicrobiales bacterium]
MTDHATVAELYDVSRTYRGARGDVAAVRGITLDACRGEILGVGGPSGSGKSTLLRLLAGIERPDRGTVSYGGLPAWSGWARAAAYPRPGYAMAVFQDPFASLDPRWPIWRLVSEPLTARRRGAHRPAERRAVAADWLARAGLGHLDPATRPGELSGGQCQRVAILRALVAEPALIVADEPTARQDVITAAAMAELLRDAATQGAAVVVVSHDARWLDSLAHRAVRLEPTPSLVNA